MDDRQTLPLRLLGVGRTRIDALEEIRRIPVDDPERPVLLALLKSIRYVVKENRKAAQRLEKEPRFMYALQDGYERWVEKERRELEWEVIGEVTKKIIQTLRKFREACEEAEASGELRGARRGELKGRAQSLLKILSARRIPVSAARRAQILKCSDVALLDRWIERALVAESASEVLNVDQTA